MDRGSVQDTAPLEENRPGETQAESLGEAFFQTVVDSLSSGILVADREGRIVYGNEYTLRWSGHTGGSLHGMTLAEFCPGIAELASRGESSGETSCEFCEKNCYIGFRLFDLPPGGGRAAGGRIVSFTDLSRIVELRRALRLKDRLAAMGEVIARVAHEIRNPLFAITGAAQILARELELGAKHGELLDSVLAQARRLNGTIQGLLDYSRDIYLNPGWFDLREVATEVARTHPLLAALRGVSVRAEPGTPVEVFGDREHIRGVIHRLIENAAEASAEGGSVEIAVQEMEGEVVLRVLDRGRGVPDPDRERIFQLYVSTKVEGRGLGLPLSRKIAEAHGGTLTYASRPGGGAIFTLRLPRGGRGG